MQYILAEFVQCNFAKRGEYEGMYAYHSITTFEIPCMPYTDSSIAQKYGCEDKDIYKCDFVNPVEDKRPGVIVDPRIENWATANYEDGTATAEVWLGDNPLKMSEGEYYIGENTEERLAIHLWGPNDGWNGQNMVVVFKVYNQVKKILVVTPPAQSAE